jgi:GTP pyrophosphokinase
MLDKDVFLKKYRYSNTDFSRSGLDWDDLVKIHQSYLLRKVRLEPVASLIAGWLRLIPEAHTVLSRVKDPEHLIEKIVRYSIKNGQPYANPENYHSIIKDLTGARILHRFKEEWVAIHPRICGISKLDGKPEAYFRKGDPKGLIDAFRRKGFKIEPKDVGYRSIQYVIVLTIGKESFPVEVQVRTLFEEAWGEVDHYVRYPYEQNNLRLKKYFLACAVVSGLADELGSLAKMNKEELSLKAERTEKARRMRSKLLAQIKEASKRLLPLAKEVQSMVRGL